MKIGDLVRVNSIEQLVGKIGIITDISIPTVTMPYQVVTVLFNDGYVSGISAGQVEVINCATLL